MTQKMKKQAPYVPPVGSRPMIKQSCDMQLQSAFQEENWPLVLNLAKQRYKSTKDGYYLVSSTLMLSKPNFVRWADICWRGCTLRRLSYH
jgi:hypothetical protein